MEQSQKATRTNLAEWWGKQFAELDLPSGLHVVVRDVDIEDLLTSGNLPNTLMEVLPELQDMDEKEAGTRMMSEHPAAFAELLNGIACSCLVEPKIGDVTDGVATIALDDLRGKDKMFLFQWANREAKQVRPFREGEDEPAATAQPG
jgi:hypothetical protein